MKKLKILFSVLICCFILASSIEVQATTVGTRGREMRLTETAELNEQGNDEQRQDDQLTDDSTEDDQIVDEEDQLDESDQLVEEDNQEPVQSEDNDETDGIDESLPNGREESQALVPEYRDSLGGTNSLMRAASPYWTGSAGNRYFYNAYGTMFGSGKSIKVIDISQHNGTIDWEKVKNSKDVDGVIVRLGWAWDGTDTQAARNISELNRLGIPYGIYLYSYARTKTDAKNEAVWLKSLMTKFNAKPTLPIYYDIEYWPNGGYYDNGKWISCPTTTAEYVQIIPEFLNTMKGYGYTDTHVYSYRSYVQNQLNHSSILPHISWIAEYGSNLNYSNAYYSGLSGWQYTSSGSVSGISGRVDINAFSNIYGANTQHTSTGTTGKTSTEPTLSYQAKVQHMGWQSTVCETNSAGTTGKALSLYQLKLYGKNLPTNAKITAKVYGSSYGWLTTDNALNSAALGKEYQSMQFVSFTMSNVSGYRLEYRVHSASVGWQAWVKSGTQTGTSGKNIQAIEFRLVKDSSVVTTPTVYYSTHVQSVGWNGNVGGSTSSGVAGSNRRVEAIKVGLNNASGYKLSGKVHVQGTGWVTYSNITSSTVLGTTGQGKRIEAVSFDLSGVSGYKLQYRAYIKSIGWIDWVDENQIAGTIGASLQIESIQLRLVKDTTATQAPQIYYSSHVQGIGWQATKMNGDVSGTSGQSRRVEAFRIVMSNVNESAKIEGKVHIQGIGWKSYSNLSNGSIIGTTGQSKRIEAINFKLTGMPGYKLQYRVHIQGQGWTGWIDQGNNAGTTGKSRRIEAIQMRIVKG